MSFGSSNNRNYSYLDHPADEPLDDLDHLFARLDRPAPPLDLTARVLARTVQAAPAPAPAGRLWPWLLAAFGALTLLVFSGYQIGVLLAASDGLDVLGVVTSDLTLWFAAPGDTLAAVMEVMPWPLVGLAAVCAAVLVWLAGEIAQRIAAGHALPPTTAPRAPRLEMSA